MGASPSASARAIGTTVASTALAKPGDDPAAARAIVRPFVDSGLTWWTDHAGPVFGPYDAIRRRIEQGPPRIE